MKQLVTTEWLEKNIDQVKVLDATWCLPNSNRNAEEEFNLHHIKNSIFFDIDKNSDQNTSLPHMLPSKQKWEETKDLSAGLLESSILISLPMTRSPLKLQSLRFLILNSLKGILFTFLFVIWSQIGRFPFPI